VAGNSQLYPLKKSSEFAEISKKGTRHRLSKWLTLAVLGSTDGNSYFGMTVSSKVGIAVLRNKLKRWVRHSVRNEKWPENLQGKSVVFMFRAQPDGFYKKLTYGEFRQTIALWINKTST